MRLNWRRIRRSRPGTEVRARMESIETHLLGDGGDGSPLFGLQVGETRRIVIDGTPFDVSRDEE